MIAVVATLIGIGILIGLLEYVASKVPNFPPIIKTIVYVVIVVCVVVWLAGLFGLLPAKDIPVPSLR